MLTKVRGDKVRVTKPLGYSNSFQPALYIRVATDPQGSEVAGRLRLLLAVRVFLTVMFGIPVVGGVAAIVTGIRSPHLSSSGRPRRVLDWRSLGCGSAPEFRVRRRKQTGYRALAPSHPRVRFRHRRMTWLNT